MNHAACTFGLEVLQEAQSALDQALPDKKDKIEEVLSKLKAEFSAQLSLNKKGRGKVAAADKPAVKRAPSAYNIFMGEKMKELGKESKLTKSELMKKVAALWKEQQAKK